MEIDFTLTKNRGKYLLKFSMNPVMRDPMLSEIIQRLKLYLAHKFFYKQWLGSNYTTLLVQYYRFAHDLFVLA